MLNFWHSTDKIGTQRCNLTFAQGKWISWQASKRFILLARLGKLPCHKKLGIFMFSLASLCFHCRIIFYSACTWFKFCFCGPNLQSVTKHFGRNSKIVYIYNLIDPRTPPFNVVCGNTCAKCSLPATQHCLGWGREGQCFMLNSIWKCRDMYIL